MWMWMFQCMWLMKWNETLAVPKETTNHITSRVLYTTKGSGSWSWFGFFSFFVWWSWVTWWWGGSEKGRWVLSPCDGDRRRTWPLECVGEIWPLGGSCVCVYGEERVIVFSLFLGGCWEPRRLHVPAAASSALDRSVFHWDFWGWFNI